MVECSTTLNCSTNGTLMNARECCIGSADGLAYSIPGKEGCHICIGIQPIGNSICIVQVLFFFGKV